MRFGLGIIQLIVGAGMIGRALFNYFEQPTMINAAGVSPGMLISQLFAPVLLCLGGAVLIKFNNPPGAAHGSR